MRERNIKRGRNASCFMMPILHRHYCRVYRAVNLPWTRLILTRAAHQIIRAETWHCGESRRQLFHATAASWTEKQKRLDLLLFAARDERSNVGRNWNSMADLFHRNCEPNCCQQLYYAPDQKSLKKKKLSQVDSITVNQWSVRSIELSIARNFENLISLMTMNTKSRV